MAHRIQALARVSSRSSSFDKRRLARSQARVRSTSQRFVWRQKVFFFRTPGVGFSTRKRDPQAVAWGPVLGQEARKRMVPNAPRPPSQQGGRPPRCSRCPPRPRPARAGPLPGVSSRTRRWRPLTRWPASKPSVSPVAVAAFFPRCVARRTPVGGAFWGHSPDKRPADKPLARRVRPRAAGPRPRAPRGKVAG